VSGTAGSYPRDASAASSHHAMSGSVRQLRSLYAPPRKLVVRRRST
jgi:hypothetical protein